MAFRLFSVPVRKSSPPSSLGGGRGPGGASGGRSQGPPGTGRPAAGRAHLPGRIEQRQQTRTRDAAAQPRSQPGARAPPRRKPPPLPQLPQFGPSSAAVGRRPFARPSGQLGNCPTLLETPDLPPPPCGLRPPTPQGVAGREHRCASRTPHGSDPHGPRRAPPKEAARVPRVAGQSHSPRQACCVQVSDRTPNQNCRNQQPANELVQPEAPRS